jgi:uncharacterized repeat protein (TIGR01451 family)
MRGDRSAWGDYDNDGDLDILLVGSGFSRVYRNDGGDFVGLEAGFAGVGGGSLAWGDYDGDGDLDVLLTGDGGSGPSSRIYRNDDCPAVSQVDLSMAKSVSPPWVRPGGALTYTLAFANQGTLTATQVTITDVVPVSVTVTGVISSGAAVTDTGTGPGYVWQVQDLLPGEGGTITLTGVLARPLAAGTYTNTAQIAAREVDLDPGDNWSGAGTIVPNVAPVAVAGPDQTVGTGALVILDGSGSSEANGETLAYLWTQNDGPAVTLGDRNGVSTTFTAPSAASVLSFTLTVTDTSGLNRSDRVAIIVVEGAPVLEVTKSVAGGDLGAVPLDSVVTYTVAIRNSGTGLASSVVMTDPLPTGVTFGAWVAQGGGTVNLPLQTVTWGPADVAPGGAYTLVFTAQVTGSADFAGETVANVAYVGAANALGVDDSASFVVEGAQTIYLPLVMRND